MCDTKESCIVDASRDMFGHSECSDKVDSDMKLWIMYRCDGGQESNQVNREGSCLIQPAETPSSSSPADTITRQALTPPPTPVEKITGKTATPPTTNTITHQSSTFPTSPDVTTTP